MEQARRKAIGQRIRDAAQEAAASSGLSVPPIERFLWTGQETWDGAGSGRFTLAQIKQEGVWREAAKVGVRTLFLLLAKMLPNQVQLARAVAPEAIRERIEPMVKGLVQPDWQDVGFREFTRRTFVLNFPGARAALEAELSTGFLGTAWQILWAYFGDYGLKPDEIRIEIDGVSGGEFAHVRWSATRAYSDVIVHRSGPLAALSEARALRITCSTRPGTLRRCRVSASRTVRLCL